MTPLLSAPAEIDNDIAPSSPIENGEGAHLIQKWLQEFRDTKVGKIVWPNKNGTEEAATTGGLVTSAAPVIDPVEKGEVPMPAVDTAEEVMETEEVPYSVRKLVWESAKSFFEEKGGYPSLFVSPPDRFLEVGYAGSDESSFRQQLLTDIEKLRELFRVEFPDFIIRLSQDIKIFDTNFRFPVSEKKGIRGRFQISFFTRAKKGSLA